MDSSPLDYAQNLSQELQSYLKEFECKAKELFVQFDSRHQQHAPSVLYHYTSDVGLYGMLENGSVWLSDVFSMNDPSELRHGILLAVDVFRVKRPSEIAIYEQWLKILLENVPGTGHYLACSFSEEKDDLGQWRAYADDGRGYSIGFNGKLLEQAFEVSATRSGNFQYGSFSITYGKTELLENYERLIEFIPSMKELHSKHSLPCEQAFQFFTYLFSMFGRWAILFSLHFKHPAYINEKEYRFLEMGDPSLVPPLKFRRRADELVKYHEFDWRKFGIKPTEIVIGPAADYERARAFAQRCLDDSGFKNVEIVRSDIPYRSCN